MYNILNNIYKDLKSGIVKKDNYKKYLNPLEKEIESLCIKWNYNENSLKTKHQTYERNLKCTLQKQEISQKNPEEGLTESIDYWKNILSDFFNIYKIGFVSEFKITKTSNIQVNISCLISNSSTFGNNKISKEIMFSKQLDTLVNFGLELIKENNNIYYLKLCEKNIDKINSLLTEIGATYIKFHTIKDKIRNIYFNLKPNKLNILKEKIEKIETNTFKFDICKDLNPDEQQCLLDLCKHMNCVNDITENLKDEVLFLLISYFTEMCEILNEETILSKKYKEGCLKNKEINKRNKDIVYKIGKNMPINKISETIQKINDIFNDFTLSNLSFYGEIEIKPYNFCTFIMRYNSEDYSYDDNLIDEKQLKTIFKTCGTSKEDEDLYILDDSDNKTLICEILQKRISSISVDKIITEKYKNQNWIIKEISGTINNISDFF